VQAIDRQTRIFLAVVGLLVNGANLFAAVDRLLPSQEAIPPTLFAMHIHSLVVPRPGMKSGDPWPTVSFGAWRVHDAYVSWPDLEPSKGQWKFSTLDRYVELAQEHHVEILLPLLFSPQWASAKPEEKSSRAPGNAALPRNHDDWRNYVRTVASRYKGRIHNYEIWNEPSVSTYFSGTPNEMVTLTREAREILKEIDPQNFVVSPSAAEGGMSWLDQFLAAGGGKYVDVIGYHFYVRQNPEAMAPIVQQARRTMERYGVGTLPLWNTETGWRIENHRSEVKAVGSGRDYIPVLTEEEASAYVARAYLVAWASGISRFYWYAWDNGVMGLTEADGATVKTPARAYNQIEDWLVGARMRLCDRYSGLWSCRLERDGGYSAIVVWSVTGSHPFDLQAAWNIRQERDLEGTKKNITGAKTVEIGPKPILLENRAQ